MEDFEDLEEEEEEEEERHPGTRPGTIVVAAARFGNGVRAKPAWGAKGEGVRRRGECLQEDVRLVEGDFADLGIFFGGYWVRRIAVVEFQFDTGWEDSCMFLLILLICYLLICFAMRLLP